MSALYCTSYWLSCLPIGVVVIYCVSHVAVEFVITYCYYCSVAKCYFIYTRSFKFIDIEFVIGTSF
jgi:hypothetical protein